MLLLGCAAQEGQQDGVRGGEARAHRPRLQGLLLPFEAAAAAGTAGALGTLRQAQQTSCRLLGGPAGGRGVMRGGPRPLLHSMHVMEPDACRETKTCTPGAVDWRAGWLADLGNLFSEPL